MKYLLLFFALIGNVFANDFSTAIRVNGSGETFIEARNNAFRKAVEIKVGTLIIGTRETTNYSLNRNEVLTYSAGYVETFKIINEGINNGRHTVIMDVVVADSKIIDGLLGKYKHDKMVDGSKVNVPYDTFVQARDNKHKMMARFLETYPSSAYELKVGKVNLRHDGNGNAHYQLPFELTFNQKWVDSLQELLSSTSDSESGIGRKMFYGALGVQPNRSLGEVEIRGNKYHYNDIKFVKDIINTVHTVNMVQINIEFFNDNKLLFSECYTPKGINGLFYQIDMNRFTINNSNAKEKNSLIIEYNKDSYFYKALNDSNRVSVSVKPYTVCEKNKLNSVSISNT